MLRPDPEGELLACGVILLFMTACAMFIGIAVVTGVIPLITR